MFRARNTWDAERDFMHKEEPRAFERAARCRVRTATGGTARHSSNLASDAHLLANEIACPLLLSERKQNMDGADAIPNVNA